jgi:hypothetical protein
MKDFLDQLSMDAVFGLLIVLAVFVAAMYGALSRLVKSRDTKARE